VVTVSLFFHKNHLYESYLIFVTKWQKNSPPKKKKKKKKNCIFLFWEPIGTYSEKMAISSSLPLGPSVTPIPYFNFKPGYSQSDFGLQGKDIVFRLMIELVA